MNRTAEKVLGVISLVFTALGVIASIFGAVFYNMISSNADFRTEMEMEFYSDPSMTPADIDMIFKIIDGFGGFLWLGIVFLVISLVLTIIGLVNIWKNKNPKLAGIMFILGGLTGGILSLTSILLYIAGILSLTKKPKTMYPDDQIITDTPPDDGGMRPL
ncbi:DUF4064 domain-containing protein [Sporosarcina sp. BI001-red]|uniref:DUF4064 domain-containing protein n=1 Tax=Sporosarcina sp. BI001-red TaxID=2282866 RepID=UPI000E22385A|nr:DUF4064 domain-containing protein [Sporosarcina sp. BI001-red]REB07786.1 DUF4064 domain-containing protein [Sporosarcina sp. BI001-red]